MKTDIDPKDIHYMTKRHREDVYKDDLAYSYMVGARVGLLRTDPFWGNCSVNLILVEIPQSYRSVITTLAVDGYHIYYNPEFILSLKSGEVMFAVAHEVTHVICNHVGKRNRLAGRNSKIWNYATDYYINYTLKEQNVGTFITTIEILYDKAFANMSSDEIYDLLIKNGGGDGSKTANPDGPKKEGQFDYHVETEDAAVGYKPDSEEEEEGNEEKWKKVVQEAAIAQYEKNKTGGRELPDFIKRIINQLIEPKKNWKSILKNFVTRIISRGYSFRSPNKSLFQQGFTIPGFRTERQVISLAIAIDVSGSINQKQLTIFLSEIKGILSSFENFQLDIWCFGSQVLEEDHITITSVANFSTVEQTMVRIINALKNGGGTVFESNWEFMKKKRILPKVFTVFTDGLPNAGWGDSRYCPTIFLVYGTRNVAPFGKTIFYDD